MKQIKLIVSILLTFVIIGSLTFAASGEQMYIYTNESGELVKSNEYQYDDATLITDQDDLNNLYNDDNTSEQETLKKAFENQKGEIAGLIEASEENNQELIITKILSDVKSEYTTDGYYYYIIKYQLANVKNPDGTELPSVVILSYDVSDNQNVTSLKQGDKIYGYFQAATSEDSSYNLVQHGLKDEQIAYVSITERDRSLGIILLIAFSILLMILYAGANGAKALIPIFVALDLLFIVLVPEVEIGRKILFLAIITALELIILITVLKNGINKKTVVAITTSVIIVTLISVFAYFFANTNAISGKGLVSEEHYDLSSNVYYLDRLFKGNVNTKDLYISVIMIISAVIAACISSRLTEYSAKYAGSKDIINNIISEGKTVISEYPLIITIIFLVFDLPKIMTIVYSHIPLNQILNSETIITDASILLFAIISTLITLPIHAIISNLLMCDVEVKQISADNK